MSTGKSFKNNQIKKSYCLIKINVNFHYHTPRDILKRFQGSAKNKDIRQLSIAIDEGRINNSK